MLKYLRIAVTALGLTACVLLVALWVRSYGHHYNYQRSLSSTRHLVVNSDLGRVNFKWQVGNVGPIQQGLTIREIDAGQVELLQRLHRQNENALGFAIIGPTVTLPYWSLVILAATVAAAPWILWRFSLRTLLIATTLVAVGLGIIVLSS